MEQKNNSKLSLATLFGVVFLDMLGVGVVIPILPLVLLEPEFLAIVHSEVMRNFLLGLIIAAYPFAQFFGSPIFGGLSDRFGRRKILIFSLAGSFLGYILFALGIMFHSISILIISRLVDGFTGGSVSVATSAIADLSDRKSKTKNFGLIGMAFGLGFILGPFIGGKLADPKFVPWFNNTTPFFFTALLVLINIFFVVFKFKETLLQRRHSKINPLDGFFKIKKAIAIEELRIIFLTSFLVFFGWAFYTGFFQIYLYDKFHYGPSDVGMQFAYTGIWIAITQGLILRFISSKVKPQNILKVSIIGTSIVLMSILLIQKPILFLVSIPFMAMFFGMINPAITTLLSNSVSAQSQGEIMGISNAVIALSNIIPPILAGFSLDMGTSYPIIISSSVMLVAGILFVLLYKHKEVVDLEI